MIFKPLKMMCREIIDCPHSTPIWTKTGKIVIRNFNIKSGFLDIATPSYTNEEEYARRVRRGKPEPGDIIITREAPMGEVCIVPDNVECCLGQRMVLLKIDESICDNNFLLYALLSPTVQNQIISSGTGSVVTNLRIPTLETLGIPYFDLPAQKLIAYKLKKIDEAIVNNTKQANIFQQLVEDIYESWFVDYNYPDITGESNNGIPIGWQQSNVFERVTEVKIKNKDNCDYPVLSVVKEGEFRLSDDVFTKQVYSKNTTNYKIVKKNQVGYNPARANIGSIAMLKDYEAGLVSPIYVVFEMKESITPTFFYYYMKQPMFLENIKHHSIGTTRQNFSFEAFKMFPLVIPPMGLQLKFEEIAKPIEQKIAKLKEENVVLAEIRDTLLPKLMSGELPVEVGEE